MSNKRIPRKPGQPAGSKKHSDLYTDETLKAPYTASNSHPSLMHKHQYEKSKQVEDPTPIRFKQR